MSGRDQTDTVDWHPVLAGAVAGAIAALAGSVLALVLRSPDEIVANSLTVTIAALVLGVAAGLVWRRSRATARPARFFAMALVVGFAGSMAVVAAGELFLLDNLTAFAVPIAGLIFVMLALLVPLLSTIARPRWIGVLTIAAAIVVGVALFGKGNVASGELALDDLATTSTTHGPTGSEPLGISGEISIPADLANEYVVSRGIVTYEVPEILRGLSTVGVGESTAVTGSISPGGVYEFLLDLQSFTSDQSRRDSRVVGWFSDFPIGTFSGSNFNLPAAATVGVPVAFSITGDLTINDITLPTTWQIEARVESNGDLSILGETDIVLSDFDIPVQTGVIVMEDFAHLEVLVSATPST